MSAIALVALLAVLVAQAPGAGSLSARLELEGPLGNDTDLVRNAEAHAALVAGDKEIAATRDSAVDEAQRERSRGEALDAWRRALQVSSPLDAVELDERRSIAILDAVRSRLTPDLRARYRARFGGLAEVALIAAGSNEEALERVAHLFPFTRAALSASLVRFDLCAERGAWHAAAAALNQASADSAYDTELQIGIDARRASLPGFPRVNSEPLAHVAGRSLRLAAVLDLAADTRGEPDRRLEPSGCADGSGRVWFQSGEQLVMLRSDGTHLIFAPARLVSDGGARVVWLPGFGDEERPWLQRPAASPDRVALVLGRARETRGNALALFDTSVTPPRLAWIHADDPGASDAPLPGRLEYQPGPLLAQGLVVVQVNQWIQAAQSPDEQHVDPADTHAWLVAFEAHDGRPAWMRRVASGADRRGRAQKRFAAPRSSSVASSPLALAGDEICAATELGVVARVALADGRLIDSLALERAPYESDRQPGYGGPLLCSPALGASSLFACSPADSDRRVYFLGSGTTESLLVSGLERLVGGTGTRITTLLRIPESPGVLRTMLCRIDRANGERVLAVPLPRAAVVRGAHQVGARVFVTAADSLFVYDDERDLALAQRLVLPFLEREPHVGVWSDGTRVYGVGLGRIWVLGPE